MDDKKNNGLQNPENVETSKSLNFLEQIIENDITNNKNNAEVHTRFPPEPNGYLHIGHAKSICLNFGLALKYQGKCNLRFDDTNPVKEDIEYIESIKEDVKWLGFEWDDREFYASDYFQQLHDWAIKLIKDRKAYVCELSPDEVSEFRGVPTRPGKESPYRNRSVEENLELFEKMKNGNIEEGKMFLRAKIDMSSPNMHLRDPIIYRIKKTTHHRTGDKWCIYPMYDYAHGQSDYLEGITHSICTLEFEVHRPLYEWFLDQLYEKGKVRPRQYEFARLNLNYTVMSKRKLLELVEGKFVCGWDDPRMPTICGLRRRGYTPASIRNFAERVGVARRENIIDVGLLEYSVREDLNKNAKRLMCVIDPVKVIIDNYDSGKEEFLDAVNNPEDESMGIRNVPFSNELYIEREDFMEDAPSKFFRLAPGREVRLRYAYFVTCNNIIKNDNGQIIELHCTYDPESKGGKSPDGRKVKGTLHWVSAKHAVDVEVRNYDRLFINEKPEELEQGKDFKSNLNPNSLQIVKAYIEPDAKKSNVGDKFQFERLGYYCADKDSTQQKLVFNRTVGLKDSWTKISGKD
ncbi:MAG: glutamine--tRNA ligase/YqeY domain fusion protein [Bacteroidota bacterium]